MALTLTHLYSLSRRRMESLREPYMHLSPSNVLASLLAPEDKDEGLFLKEFLHGLCQPVKKVQSYHWPAGTRPAPRGHRGKRSTLKRCAVPF